MDTFADAGQEQAQYLRWAQLTCAGEVAAMIAHDINNAITGVISYTELAGMDLPEWSEASAFLEKTLEQAHRVSDLANQMLDLSHEADSFPAPQNVAASLRAACFLLARRLDRDHISFESMLEVQDVAVLADPSRLLTVWLNLLLIARSLLVEAQSDAPKRLGLTARKGQGAQPEMLEVRLQAECEHLRRFAPQPAPGADAAFARHESLLYAGTEVYVKDMAGSLHMESSEGSLAFVVALPARALEV